MDFRARSVLTGAAQCAAACLLAACGPAPESAAGRPAEVSVPVGSTHDEAEAQRLAGLEKAALARFEPHGGGTVTQVGSALQWMRCSVGQDWDGNTCVGEARRMGWEGARKTAAEARLGGHADWRLPSRTELYGLVHCSSGMRRQSGREGEGGGCAGRYRSPTILDALFPATPPGNFWSGTAHETLSYAAWGVSFNAGIVGAGARNDYVYVRLVRDLR